MAAEAFGVAASALAVVELSAKIVKICAQYTKDVANARHDIERLQKEVESLGLVADSVRELTENTSKHKLNTIEKVQSLLDEGRTRLAELHTKLEPGQRERNMSRVGLRAMRWPFSSKDVGKTLANLARLTQAVSLAMSVDQTTLLISLEQKIALAKMPIAQGAAYDSHANEHIPQCLENTRTEVLREIIDWARDSSSKTVYWLNGMAGTGKSTISRTIANNFSKKDDLGAYLGASFFFKRGEGDSGNMSKFFTTITSQIVQQLPEIAGYVQAAIEADPALISKALQIQFETLILNPITKISLINPVNRIFLLVIDALDECERQEDVRLLIRLLSGIPRPMAVQLKFFLTSRPELPIRLGFNSINGRYRDLILHEVEEPIIEHDLQVYIEHEIERIRLAFNQDLPEERRLPQNWPNATDIGSLVQMAIPLFIFAATICRFIADRKGGNPEKKLRRVLEFRSGQGSKLMATYMPVLKQLTMDLASEEQSEILLQFQQIVGSIVVLADPLGSKPLSRLLNVEINEIMELLDFLHSVLQVPLSTEQPIRLLHLSFRDFLVNPARQENPFWVDQRRVHQQLAEQCLRVLNSSLKNDICNVKGPGTLASSISASRVRTSIPPELQYACRFWVYHLRESSSTDLNTADIWDFLRSHFLNWLEALSWMGRLPESFGIVTALQSISLIEKDYEMIDFLKDSVRFLQAAHSSMQIAPLQAYSSLAFAPSQSIVRRIYEGDLSAYIEQGPKMPSSWDDRLQTFEVYTGDTVQIKFLSGGKLLCVDFWHGAPILLAADTGEHVLKLQGNADWRLLSAFSPDGKLLASVTDSSTVSLWHTETGKPQQMLNGHKAEVKGAVFSPDSRFLASVSADGVVISWVVNTYKQQQKFKLPRGRLWDHGAWLLAISPDNELHALTSFDHTIILWRTETGKCRRILKGHSARIKLIEFSPVGKVLVSAAEDQTIILWDTQEGKKLRVLKAHTGTFSTVAFSLGNGLLASGMGDGTVILWQTKTGQRQSLEGHDSSVKFIAFSPNGKLLASTSRGGTVILWATETGKRLRTIEGGVNQDNYVSFSPDSKRLAATSGRGSISIWAIDTIESGQILEKHSKSVNLMKFSPDGELLASTSFDESIMLWRTDTGEYIQTLEGQSLWITAIDFSPDSKFLASASADRTVVLWTVDTGERWQTLRGHNGFINKAIFSPDGKMIVSASEDQSVVLWATDTGERRQTLKGHSAGVKAIAFSPNGKILASASDDRTVILWAADTGERRQIIKNSGMATRQIAFSGDSKLLALDSGEPVTIWVAETNEDLQTPLEIGHNESSLQYPSLPRIGVVRKPSVSAPESGSNGMGDDIGVRIGQDGHWICSNGEPILWLPITYRPCRSTVSGYNVAMGYLSGRVLVVRLKSPDVDA